ncbi:MAG: GGDEF domain-containing protein [Lachnospiraceae bacterium]|nr:GGDEF domain-containing protein [Lachnospiraceae bacterium]
MDINFQAEIERLKKIVSALMYGYNTIFEADLKTGKVSLLKSNASFFSEAGMTGELPLWDELVNMYITIGVFEEDRDIARQVMDRNYIREHLEYGQGISQEYRNNHGIYGETRIVRIDENTVIIAFAEKHQAIIERKNKIYKDSLTLVNNRKYYDDYLEIQLCQALVMSDIDHFKDINDHFGHLCGDAALAAVANALQSNVRGSDVVVRYGGDEFLIIFKNISEDVLRNRMEQMRKAVTEITLDKYPNVSLSMSFGVTYGNGKIKDMLETADELMYEAKKMRNSILFKAF